MKLGGMKTVHLCAQTVIVLMLGGCLESGSDDGPGITPPIDDNRAPAISGTPNSSVLMGDPYSFLPVASDPDDDPLTFIVQGEPTWLDINSSSGALTGTPSLGDVGVHTGIVVSVNDGELSASLAQFSVTVVANADGSVTLSWTAPTLNEDGTALTDLASYKIHYGTSSRNYTVEIPVDLGTTMLVVNNLTPDTYYFAATAINLSDVESQFSGEAIRIVN
jgi:hypothetical protein